MCVCDFIFVCACSRFLSLTHTPSIIGVCVGSTGRHLLHVVSFNFLKCPLPQVLDHRSSSRFIQELYRQTPLAMNAGIPKLKGTAAVLLETRPLLMVHILVEV